MSLSRPQRGCGTGTDLSWFPRAACIRCAICAHCSSTPAGSPSLAGSSSGRHARHTCFISRSHHTQNVWLVIGLRHKPTTAETHGVQRPRIAVRRTAHRAPAPAQLNLLGREVGSGFCPFPPSSLSSMATGLGCSPARSMACCGPGTTGVSGTGLSDTSGVARAAGSAVASSSSLSSSTTRRCTCARCMSVFVTWTFPTPAARRAPPAPRSPPPRRCRPASLAAAQRNESLAICDLTGTFSDTSGAARRPRFRIRSFSLLSFSTTAAAQSSCARVSLSAAAEA